MSSSLKQLSKMISGGKPIYINIRHFHKTSLNLKRETCNPGICLKKEILVKQFLNTTDANYLRPNKRQVNLDNLFKEGKPLVKPVIDMSLERNCRIVEECMKLKAGIRRK